MRKRIGAYLGNITSSFQETIIRKIISKANELDYDTMFMCTYGSYHDDILYSEGECAFAYLPDYATFDGLIISEDLFDIVGMQEAVYNQIINTAKCPVVYIRSIHDGCYSILTSNEKSMEQATRHFTDDHGFTDICYMSGKQGSLDTTERLQGFLNVMKEKGLPVKEHTIFHGDYWRDKGQEAIDWFMEGRDTYPQAIICANDYMALSVCDELRRRGVRVPEDVCVSGFDHVEEAMLHTPSISSLGVDFENIAEEAVEIIDKVNRGEKVERLHYHPAKLHIHNSCCGEQVSISALSDIIEENYLHTATTRQLILSVMEFQDCIDEDDYLRVADKYHTIINSERKWVCICDTEENGFSDVENYTKFSENMILKRIFYPDKPADKPHIVFPRKQLLPDEVLSDTEYNNFIFSCLHFKNKVYGYMVTEVPKTGWFQIYMEAYYVNLSNAIETTYSQKALADLEQIKNLYHRDALTGLYNRRGYDKMLRDRFDASKQHNSKLGIVSIDMDGLKSINDTYGHSSGDEALKSLAEALNNSMLENEFCGRIGGDEFAAIINTEIPNRVETFKEAFYNAIDEINKTKTTIPIGASIGICDISENFNAPLVLHVRKADIRMYEDKKTRKQGRIF